MSDDESNLNAEEIATYEWQMSVDGFGAAGQRALKRSSVLVTRCGGVGGAVAYYLAAAGVGKLVLAHGGNVLPSDLNRQILMTHESLGKPRVACAAQRLKELNPRLSVETFGANAGAENVEALVSGCDLIVDCAPLFKERLCLNREAVRQKKSMVDCAMFEMEAQLTTFVPGRTACLACLVPAEPPAWKRQFPVFGAVAGAVGSLAALEAIKVLAGLGEPLLNRMLIADLRAMRFRTLKIERNPLCAVCSTLSR